jgi:CTP synthase
MKKEKLDERVIKKLKLTGGTTDPDLDAWKEFLGRLKNPTEEVTIGLVGKYVELPDAYKSIIEAFIHAGAQNECKVNLKLSRVNTWIRKTVGSQLQNLDGILVAPVLATRF